jgi:hypothetical protein
MYSISLNNPEDITNLISMTPYYWSITDSMRGRIGEIMELKTELDFNIDVFRKSKKLFKNNLHTSG